MPEGQGSGPYRRLAVFDLDHTLLNDHAEITDDVAERLKAARSPDLACTIASGRDMQRIVPFLNQLEWLSVPVIAEQGAVVANPADGRLLLERMVSREVILGSLDVVRSCGLAVQLLLYGRGQPQAFHPAGAPGRGDGMRVFIDEHDVDTSDVRKITLICAPEDVGNLQQTLNRTLGPAATVVRADVNFLNVMDAGVSKGTALAWLMSYLGIPRGNVMAVGDCEADQSMFAQAGTSVAVANADAETRSLAHFVVPANNVQGAAVALEKFARDEFGHVSRD